MGRVVVVTFDENEEEKLNELLHFLSAKKYSEMPNKQNRVLNYGALKINAEYRSVESNGELVQLTNYEFEILFINDGIISLRKSIICYNSKNIVGVIEIFSKNCELIKRQIYEARFDIDTSYTDLDESFINSRSAGINNSYRLVNDKIIRLKKFEFDFINLSEFLKNYLVAQEIVVKLSFSAKDEIQFEPIEHLFKLFEDCLNYKIDDMNDDIIFNRRVLIRMMKNQKNCLGLSLEYGI